MNNYERIKNMTITELSYFLSECNSICDFCVYHFNTQECLTKKCVVGINKWLEQEVKNDDFEYTELKKRLPDEIVARNL